MDDKPNDKPSPRIPTREDLVRIAKSLNQQGVRYVVIGGLAMLYHGLARATTDIDLLVDPSPENVQRIRLALSFLEDKAVLEVNPTDLETYTIVRVADTVIVDLLASACGVSFEMVETECEITEIDGVTIPFLSARALLQTKRSIREKDHLDCYFLEELLHDVDD